ncbi:calmodulin-binding protein 25-like [Phalaenopsis equestris]|uniref:calmodulin-binding protein 25-like n=1 Tax=Phalaenopsis equestris TaxID=78828 RepID=UPI0009E49C97|nr:calmodulin-binding protein 25-like [Phalaenopsis equestris]
MAENGSTVQSWNHYETQSWIPPIYARENEALTKALQISLSDDSSTSETLSYLPPFPPSSAKQVSTIQNRSSIYRKIAKRKSRVSKRTPTTYINADPANFRRMVQEVTGIRIGEVGRPVEPAVWREPEWSGLDSFLTRSRTCITEIIRSRYDQPGPSPSSQSSTTKSAKFSRFKTSIGLGTCSPLSAGRASSLPGSVMGSGAKELSHGPFVPELHV